MLPERLWTQSSSVNNWVKEEMTASALPQDSAVVPNQRHPCPVFVKLDRTWIRGHSVITSLHHQVIWKRRLYSYRISVTLGQTVFMLGLALHPLLEAMCYLAQSLPVSPWRNLLEKAELAAPTGTVSMLCTTRQMGFWCSTRCPKTTLATRWSCDIRSLLHQHSWTEAGRRVPGGGKPWQVSHCLKGTRGDMG